MSVMSWDISVWVEDGTVTATMHGPVPDGDYVITGRDDDGVRYAALSSYPQAAVAGNSAGPVERQE